jgi:hypothetical protein
LIWRWRSCHPTTNYGSRCVPCSNGRRTTWRSSRPDSSAGTTSRWIASPVGTNAGRDSCSASRGSSLPSCSTSTPSGRSRPVRRRSVARSRHRHREQRRSLPGRGDCEGACRLCQAAAHAAQNDRAADRVPVGVQLRPPPPRLCLVTDRKTQQGHVRHQGRRLAADSTGRLVRSTVLVRGAVETRQPAQQRAETAGRRRGNLNLGAIPALRGVELPGLSAEYETAQRHYAHVEMPGHADYVKRP